MRSICRDLNCLERPVPTLHQVQFAHFAFRPLRVLRIMTTRYGLAPCLSVPLAL
jgi:hypothetical protein